MKDKTTIQISRELKDKLDSFGKRGETYEEILIRVLKLNERKLD